MKFLNKQNTLNFEEILIRNFSESKIHPNSNNNIEILVDFVNAIRPKKINSNEKFDLLFVIDFFIAHDAIRINFSNYLKNTLYQKKFSSILTDAGIVQDTDFFYEVKKRLFAKIMPYQAPKNTLEYILNQVFYSETDLLWINTIPFEQLEALFDVLEFSSIYYSCDKKSVVAELIRSINLISQRTSGRALESDVMRMVPEYAEKESPFAAFEKELINIENTILKKEGVYCINSSDINYKQLLIIFKQCNEFVEKAFINASKYGISLKVSQSLLRIKQQLNRLKSLLPLLVVDHEKEFKIKNIELCLQLINFNCQKNNVRKLINDSTQSLSYEITQHTAKTGEKYITESKSEYFKMLYAALGGGFIVGILCIIKVLLSKIETSDFGHAMYYSLNYSVGFTVIYLLGYTLATKQPAMTASALAKVLEEGLRNKNITSHKYESFAVLFARVFRSQFIAFVGNVIMAFPVSLLGIWVIDLLFDYNITSTKWPTLINDLNPVHSAAIFHAAIAGVFLFLSGIISGSVSNRDKFNQMYYRIQEHPWLKMTFGKAKTIQLAKWYEAKWAGVISNFWFGIFMGSTASVGIFLGLNLDIRHITFASGNLALALYGSGYTLNNWSIFWGIFGIGIIGLVNFLVSFSLSLGLALRSRNIPLTELKSISLSIKHYFKKNPLRFFFP